MKTETIKEIGKRMGQQKGKTYSFYTKKVSSGGGLLSKLFGRSKNK